jgi:hypothetical protein
MDKYWYPDITRDEAIELLNKCIAEVKLRESIFLRIVMLVLMTWCRSGVSVYV